MDLLLQVTDLPSNMDNMIYNHNMIKKNVIPFCVLLLTPVCASALDINTMMDNLRSNYPAIVRMIVGLAFLIGIMLMVSAVHKLRAYGEVRTMMPSNAEFSGPMIQFLIGTFLIFFPTIVNVSIYSLWGTSSILAWTPTSVNWASVEKAALGLIRILGYIAVLRGLLMMSKAAQKGSPPGMLGKGMIHLIGGILAINIEGTISVILASFGYIT